VGTLLDHLRDEHVIAITAVPPRTAMDVLVDAHWHAATLMSATPKAQRGWVKPLLRSGY
jgi:hypothetical protein